MSPGPGTGETLLAPTLAVRYDPSVKRFFGYRWKSWFRALRLTWTLADECNLGLIASGVAFWGMLGVFPALAALIAIFGLVSDAEVVAAQIELLQGLMPPDALALINAQVLALTSAPGQTLGLATLISILAALWTARAGTAALILGLNTINRRPNRHGLRHYLTAIVLTIILVGLAIVALLAIVVTPIALSFLPLGDTVARLVEVLRWAVAILVLIVGLSLLYRFAPNRRGERMAWITPGTFVTILTWAAASAAFNFYLSNFANYNEVYGSIGAVIALLMWLYISAYLVLLGAALNVALEEARRINRAAEGEIYPPLDEGQPD